MGSNSSTGNKSHPTRKIEEREENGPSENDIETNDYLNDKVSILTLSTYYNELHRWCNAGAEPGFQVGGGALKKIAPSGGRHEHF